MTRLGGIEALRDGRRIEAEGFVSGSAGTSSRIKVGARVPIADILGVRAGELVILSCCLANTALRLATIVSGKIILLIICQFASTPDCRLNSPFEVKLSLA